ncbi:43384_t:CDS:2, partial [Gigaspora margarita]
YFETEEIENSYFDVCQLCKQNNIIVKYLHNSSTENMLGHLWTKHRIDKDHSKETDTSGMIIKAMHVITKHRQEKLTHLMNMDSRFINLTTDLWSSRINQGYIGIIATWMDSNFVLIEALLTTQLLLLSHTAENIRDLLNQVITEWGLAGQIFCITTDNSANVKKSIRLMNALINLTANEWQLLNNLILLLKPFYKATTMFSGSTYPTLNLIYPIIKLLIKKFMPSNRQTKEDYIDLLFESREHIENQSQLITDDENSDENSNELDADYKPGTSEQLYQPSHVLVKAASYLFLKEYWEVPQEVELITSFLNPQIKNLNFIDDIDIKKNIISTVQRLCDKTEHHKPLVQKCSKNNQCIKSSSKLAFKPIATSDLMADLYGNEELDEIVDKAEVNHYLCKPIQKRKCNPLKW